MSHAALRRKAKSYLYAQHYLKDGVRQRVFAKHAQLSQSTLSLWLHGNRELSDKAAARIEKAISELAPA